MEKLIIIEDIVLIGIKASSFPDGIDGAHKALQKWIPEDSNRTYYGISRPEPDTIIYRAAVEQAVPGEGDNLNLDEVILKNGNYIGITITAYMDKIGRIGAAFKELLSYPGLDPDGYCVEQYFGKNKVICMIRLEK